MSETPSKREQQRQVRRQQILDAALAVFSEKGFHGANVSDVAAAAGVSQGTIYWYFDSKEELLTAAVMNFFVGFGEEVMTGLAMGESPTEMLHAMERSMVGFVHEAEGLFALFLEYWASSQRREEAAEVWGDLLSEYKEVVAGIIEQGVQAGEFRPVDADALVWAVMATYDGIAAYALLIPDLDVDRVSRVFIETLLRGLLVEGGEPAAEAAG